MNREDLMGEGETAKDIRVVIPAYNEAESIALVLGDIPLNLCREVIVTDNNSTDNTGDIARECGATVLFEPQGGYGKACLKALDYIRNNGGCDIVVFLDADYSDHPDEMFLLLKPLLDDTADLVIGSRALGHREPGSMTPQQLFGNWLAVRLIRLLFGHRYTDLGPFRAITWKALEKIHMIDEDFGWTVEMQVKAIRQHLRTVDVPVSYRRRSGGKSKVSGTLKGSVLAGIKIIQTIFRYA